MRTKQEFHEILAKIEELNPSEYDGEHVVQNVIELLDLCRDLLRLESVKEGCKNNNQFSRIVVISNQDVLIAVDETPATLYVQALFDRIILLKRTGDPSENYHYDSLMNVLYWALEYYPCLTIELSSGKKLQL